MRRLIGIPVFHLACKVGIDKGRSWSAVDELLLWSVNRAPATITEIVRTSRLPRTLVVASLARLMRFRLVEVSVEKDSAVFKASRIGRGLVGLPLPYFPKRIWRRVSFLVDAATGDLLKRRGARLESRANLESSRRAGLDVRVVSVKGGEPLMTPEVNFARLAEFAIRGHDERLASVDGSTGTVRLGDYLVVEVVDGAVTGFPQEAGTRLRPLLQRLAREGTGDVTVNYAGPTPPKESGYAAVPCNVALDNFIIGGNAHRTKFKDLLSRARTRVVVHSTFLAIEKFEDLQKEFREACRRGVTFDILWGAESDEDTNARNALAAAKISSAVQADPDMVGRIRMHMRSTGSHAKVVLCDGADDTWTAVVGSCNWLLSPFRSVELSVAITSPHFVAHVARSLARLVGRRGNAFDDLGAELSLKAEQLQQRPGETATNAQATLIAGPTHERLARSASGAAKQWITIGSNRLGGSARPGALLQCAAAVARSGAKATVVYSIASAPLGASDVSQLSAEMDEAGVALLHAKSPKLHAKFLAWDGSDIVATSLNWASASVDSAFPEAELGVYVKAPGIAAEVMRSIGECLPKLAGDLVGGHPS